MGISIEKLKSVPKAYYILILMALVVLFLMLFGGGKETLSNRDLVALTEVKFTVKSWEKVTNEEGFPESLVLHSNEYKADFEIDPLKIADYDGLIAKLHKNMKFTAKIDRADKADLTNGDEDISILKLIGPDGKNYIGD